MNKEKLLENKIAILYFVEEACGYRHSLHWFRRFLETGQPSDLEHLIIEIGKENFVDFNRLIQAIHGDNDACWEMTELVAQHNIRIPEEWKPHDPENEEAVADMILTPVPESLVYNLRYGEQNFDTGLGNAWAVANWIEENRNLYPTIEPLKVINYAMQKLKDSQTNIYEICYFVRMILGVNTLVENVVNDDLELFIHNVGAYFEGQQDAVKKLVAAIQDSPDENWKDALSRNQVKSKIWLLDKLIEKTQWLNQKPTAFKTNDTTTFLVGGWVGILPFISSLRKQSLGSVVNVDIDESVHYPAKILNSLHPHEFRNLAKDIRTIDFTKQKNFIIVDTIVEHFEDHGQWLKTLPSGTRVVLQGNDMFDVPDHVNCHHNLDEFVEACGLNTVIWQGELTLPGCTRFMVIGQT